MVSHGLRFSSGSLIHSRWATVDGVVLDRTSYFSTGGGVLGDERTLIGP
jgi:hypothetical protein